MNAEILRPAAEPGAHELYTPQAYQPEGFGSGRTLGAGWGEVL